MRVLPLGACSWLIFIAGLVAAAYLLRLELRPTAPAKPACTVTVCSGCGSEFESYGDGPAQPITQCPNCPMSEEEFERLKGQLGKQQKENTK